MISGILHVLEPRQYLFTLASTWLVSCLPIQSLHKLSRSRSQCKSFAFRTLLSECLEWLFWRQSSTSRRRKKGSPNIVELWYLCDVISRETYCVFLPINWSVTGPEGTADSGVKQMIQEQLQLFTAVDPEITADSGNSSCPRAAAAVHSSIF